MDLLSFAVTVILITASGALAPGPLFFATITYGSKSGAKSGLTFSIAHTVVEFSIIMLFALGLYNIASIPIVKLTIGLVGGITLIVFGILQITNYFFPKNGKIKTGKSSFRFLFFIGLIFTGLNPYFIIWWLTIGAQLIIISLGFASFAGVIFMYICHVWMDYLWLTMVAYFSKKGTNILTIKLYRIIMGLFGLILIYFGINFVISSIF